MEGRRRGRAVRRGARLRPDRGREGRPVPLRRRRRDLDARRASRAIRQRAWYYSTITVDPKNADVVWSPQVPLLKSIDGGKTFRSRQGPAPRRPPRPVDRPEEPEADDRRQRRRRGHHHERRRDLVRPPLPIAQFYHVACDNRVPYRVIGRDAGPGHRAGAEQQPRSGGIRSATGTRRRRRGRARRPRPVRPEHRLRRRVRRASSRATTTARGRRATSASTPRTPPGTAARR